MRLSKICPNPVIHKDLPKNNLSIGGRYFASYSLPNLYKLQVKTCKLPAQPFCNFLTYYRYCTCMMCVMIHKKITSIKKALSFRFHSFNDSLLLSQIITELVILSLQYIKQWYLKDTKSRVLIPPKMLVIKYSQNVHVHVFFYFFLF